MSDVCHSGLDLKLPGLVLSCEMAGCNDARLMRYLVAALEDARAVLAENADVAQALEWTLGKSRARLEVAADCEERMLKRALQHLALMGDAPAPAGPVASRPRPAARSAADETLPVESRPPAAASEQTVAEVPEDRKDESGGDEERASLGPPRRSAGERDLPPFPDLDSAVAAMRERIETVPRGKLGPRDWHVVSNYYGLGGAARDYDELADQLDLTKQSVAQSLLRALKNVHEDELLAARLRATVVDQADVFWHWLEDHCGGLADDDVLESLPRELEASLGGGAARDLSRWYACFLAAHLDGTVNVVERRVALDAWMSEHGGQVTGCRVSPRLDSEELSRALKGADTLAEDWQLPQSVAFLSAQLGVAEDSLERVLSLRGSALKLAVEEGLVSSLRGGAQISRIGRIGLLMAVELGEREIGLYDLAERYVGSFPDDPVDARNIYLAVGDPRGAQHLFMPAAVTGWRGLYRGGAAAEDRLMDMKAHAKVNAGAKDDHGGRESKLPANFVAVIGLLKRHGPMSNVAMGRKLAEEEGRQASLVGLPVHQSGRIVRLGPKIYGLPEHRESIRAGKLLPEAFLDGQMLAAGAYGLRTGEIEFFFPCWNDALLGALQDAAQERRADLPLSWSRIIDPDYNVGKLYGEPNTAAVLAGRKLTVELALSASLHLAEHGGLSAAALNLLGRTRAEVLTADGVAALSAMAALGVVAGDKPWYEAQGPGPLAEAAREALTTARARTGKFDWDQPEAADLLETAREQASGRDVAWLNKGAAAKILAKV